MSKFSEKYLIFPCDEIQINLSSQYIDTHIHVLYEYLVELRIYLYDYVNWVLGKNQNQPTNIELNDFINKELTKYGKKSLINFPFGACYFITYSVFDYIKIEIERNPQLSFFKAFLKEGGVFKIIWGQIRDEFFQTAFQIGEYYVDLANDTVFLTNPKVKITKLQDSDFKNIDTISEYYSIKKIYHKEQIYPNIYYPNLAPFVPFFTVKNGVLKMEYSLVLIDLIYKSNYIELVSFIENENLEFSELPKEFLSELEAYFEKLKKSPKIKDLLTFERFDKHLSICRIKEFYNDKDDYLVNKKMSKRISKLFNDRFELSELLKEL